MTAAATSTDTPFVRRHLPFFHYVVDTMVWMVALPVTAFLRYDFRVHPISAGGVVMCAAVVAFGQGVFGLSTGLYRRRWRYGSFDELFALSISVAFTGWVLLIATIVTKGQALPRSVPILATAVAGLGTVALRSLWRLFRQKRRRPSAGVPLIVLGAGEGSYQIVQQMLTDPDSPYEPVALLDDDPHKRNLRFHGVGVQGGLADLAHVAAEFDAAHVLMAIPSASGELIGVMASLASLHHLTFLVLPPTKDLFGAAVIDDIRPVTPDDVLGRDPARIDTLAVSHYVKGRRVLVTGAGGSIGSELCRQLQRFEPAALQLLDRDESALHAVQLSMSGRAMLDDPNLILADIRDRDRMLDVFRTYRPEVVFHAAALKHLTLLEMHPDEGWKTNVLGTLNVLEAAAASGVERFVNISTDKAADAISVLGRTKRTTERLTSTMNDSQLNDHDGIYVSVRFGNVLGSRGSVLVAFESQADAGGPITVTHPDVTRYFMTVAEAVRLTIFAGAIGGPGDVMVLDMGTPVRIDDVARRFAARTEPPLEIVYTGLRPGEKLHEVLVAADEQAMTSLHPLISRVVVPTYSVDELADMGLDPDRDLSTETVVHRDPDGVSFHRRARARRSPGHHT